MPASSLQNRKWLRWAGSFLALMALAALEARSGAAPEAAAGADRFGTVGKTEDFGWNRFYNADWSNLGSRPDSNRLYTLGKLDRRAEPGLQWCKDAVTRLCLRPTVESQRALYESIFAYEKTRIPFILAHHARLGGAPPPPLAFVIGNEPNAMPYVDPEVFAGVYKAYRDFIQGPPPGGLGCGHCRVHAGGILLLDAMPHGFLSGLASAYVSVSASWKSRGGSRVAMVPHLEWTRRFLDRLHVLGGSVEAFDVHAYQVDHAPLWGLRWKSDPAALSAFLAFLKAGGGPAVSPWRYPHPKIWIGEFGTLQPKLDEAGVLAVMDGFVAEFRTHPEVKRWFWFKHAGKDFQLPDAPPVGLYEPGRELDSDSGKAVATAVGRRYIALRDRERDGQDRFLSPKADSANARATKTAPVAKAAR